jgi:hypothetical protein
MPGAAEMLVNKYPFMACYRYIRTSFLRIQRSAGDSLKKLD